MCGDPFANYIRRPVIARRNSETDLVSSEAAREQRIASLPPVTLAVVGGGEAVHAAVGVVRAVHENLRRGRRQPADPPFVEIALFLEGVVRGAEYCGEGVAPPDHGAGAVIHR